MTFRKDRRVLVVGSGSIGRRHMGNLHTLGFENIAACDPDPERLAPMVEELGVTTYADYEKALNAFSPAAVFICTPPILHITQTQQALNSGAHVFLEKPVSNTLEGGAALMALVKERGLVVQVGYNFRFHPSVMQLKSLMGKIGRLMWVHVEAGKYLPDWRRWQDYRQSYTARRELGGGIILDYSHELNYILWLMGVPTEVFCMAAHVSDLDVNVEDYAAMMLRFANGTHATVHLDFAQRQPARGCKLVGADGTLSWDVISNRIMLYRAEGDEVNLVLDETQPLDRNQSYIDEVASFFTCIAEGRSPEVSLAEGYDTLRVAAAAHESARTGSWTQLADM